MRKWKWLLVNVCECRSVISTAAEFLNPYQEGKVGVTVLVEYGENGKVERLSYVVFSHLIL
jgi:hypothetical protein